MHLQAGKHSVVTFLWPDVSHVPVHAELVMHLALLCLDLSVLPKVCVGASLIRELRGGNLCLRFCQQGTD